MADERHVQSMGILPLQNRKIPVTLIGAGATGSFTALALAKMGFTHIHVWDNDKVELHNVDNQLYGESHVGHLKVSALHGTIKSLSGVELHTHGEKYVDAQPYQDEIVVFAVDSIDVRKAIWTALRDFQFRALIDSRMAAEVFTVYTVDPRDYAAQKEYDKTFFPEEEAVRARCTEKSIMYTPFILGGFIANQVKKIANCEPVRPAITFGCREYQLLFM